MYRVVGCRDCGALWIVADRPDSTTCPRCGTRHPFDRLHAFAETDREADARKARAALLAERAGAVEAGFDPGAVAEAGERASAGPGRTPNRREAVLGALDALDRPTEDEVVEYAAERGVPTEAVPAVLERLVRAGEVSESGGRYRAL